MTRDYRIRTFAGLAQRVLAEKPRLGPVRFVAVDGWAASGKTTFARRLGVALRSAGADVAEVHVDDLLEGWTDLDSYWPRWTTQVVDPLRSGQPARYQRYDRIRQQFDEHWVTVGVPEVLILDGIGSAREESDPYRVLAVFLAGQAALRLVRGLDRDGESMRPRWLRRMAAEGQHFADREPDTVVRGDVLVDGTPLPSHDSETEYLVL